METATAYFLNGDGSIHAQAALPSDMVGSDKMLLGTLTSSADASIWVYAAGIWWEKVGGDEGILHIDPNPQVAHLASDGHLLAEFTAPGYFTPEDFDQAARWSVALPDGTMWMYVQSEAGVYQLLHYSPTGQLLATVQPQDQLPLRSFVADPAGGGFYATEHGSGNDSLVALSPSGATLWSVLGFSDWCSLFLDGDRSRLWVVDRGPSSLVQEQRIYTGSAVYHFDLDGHQLASSTAFCGPSHPALDPNDGTLWVLDGEQLVHLGFHTVISFPDVPTGFWASQEIAACVTAGVVQGYPDGTYQPTAVVTRDQMAVFVARALAGGEPAVPTSPATASFIDVPTDFWAFKHVQYCAAQKVVQGYADGTYHPEYSVDRGQMAVFIARAVSPLSERPDLPSCTPPTTADFPDVTPDFWAYKDVEYIFGQSLVNGYTDGLYHPEYACTRDQMAVFISAPSTSLPNTLACPAGAQPLPPDDLRAGTARAAQKCPR